MLWDLVADIGGTNMRLASAVSGQIAQHKTYETTGGLHLTDAVTDFVAMIGTPPRMVEVAAAGVIQNGAVSLTNADQQVFSESDLARAAGAERARILNDFEAAAWSLVTVEPSDLTAIQGSLPAPLTNPPRPTKPRLIVGPGTGLGVGTQVWGRQNPHVLQGEGGHVRVAPNKAEDIALFEKIVELWPEVSMGDSLSLEAEAIVSGTGMPCLMQALELVSGFKPSKMTSRQIFEAALRGHQQGEVANESDKLALKSVDIFSHHLGAVAGDLALALSAYGGVFLSGGVLLANDWIFDRPTFLTAFNQGGRHTHYRKAIPVYLYRNSNFGLQGAINAMTYRELA